MRRLLWTASFVGICYTAPYIASAQPLLDRVLDRVQEALDDDAKPLDEEKGLEQITPEEGVARPAGEPGYLGVVADDREEQGQGVRVLDVVAGGPAAKGGLTKNDLITAINKTPIHNMEEMARILSAMPAGTKLSFGIRRDEESKDVSVTLSVRPGPGERRFEKFGRQPEGTPQGGPTIAVGRPKLGVRTLPVSVQAQQQFNLPSRDGAVVVEVTPGSRAERAGIQVGDVIMAVDGRPIRSPDQLAELVAASADRGQMAMTLWQNGQQQRINISMGNEAASRIMGRPPVPPAARGAAPTSDDDPEIPRLAPNEPVDDETRLEAIERRLQQLEDRIEKLEQAHDSKT